MEKPEIIERIERDGHVIIEMKDIDTQFLIEDTLEELGLKHHKYIEKNRKLKLKVIKD